METAIANAKVNFLGLAYNNGQPELNITMPAPPPDPSIPFYIDVRGAVTLTATSKLQMSTDGETWTNTTSTTLPTGKTYFRVASDQTTPLRPKWTEDSNSDYDIGGNINSLVKVNFANDTNCYRFFDDQYSITFFQDKTKLKSAGDLILPATTLTDNCYAELFSGCTSLTTAPALPATTLTSWCYYKMFSNCRALTAAPALPATTLASRCYYQMFTGCWGLTTAPALPATTLAEYCYSGMFNYCNSLTTAPALPATTLVTQCYNTMFSNCTQLNDITIYANDITASGCLGYWLQSVASTGTFHNLGSAEYSSGESGIPNGWTEVHS